MKSLYAVPVLVALLASCVTTPSPDQIANADYGPPPPANYEAMIKSWYDKTLIDPESARYTFAEPAKSYVKSSPLMGVRETFGWRVCGTINAKNRFGGYTGQSPFITMFKNGAIVMVKDAGGATGMYDEVLRENIANACARTVTQAGG